MSVFLEGKSEEFTNSVLKEDLNPGRAGVIQSLKNRYQGFLKTNQMTVPKYLVQM